jgi:hypothetical protein
VLTNADCADVCGLVVQARAELKAPRYYFNELRGEGGNVPLAGVLTFLLALLVQKDE